MKRELMHTASIVLVAGSTWGILEATLGWLLHQIHLPIAGAVMFPIGLSIMVTAHQMTPKKGVVLAIGMVAALIKMINLLLPGALLKTVNPAMSIIIEACIIQLLIPYISIRFPGFSLEKAGARIAPWMGLATLAIALTLEYWL